MTETKGSSTKVLFDSLTKLYKQGQMLLMDADRLMDEREWGGLCIRQLQRVCLTR